VYDGATFKAHAARHEGCPRVLGEVGRTPEIDREEQLDNSLEVVAEKIVLDVERM
jgi:hypothetical protein